LLLVRDCGECPKGNVSCCSLLMNAQKKVDKGEKMMKQKNPAFPERCAKTRDECTSQKVQFEEKHQLPYSVMQARLEKHGTPVKLIIDDLRNVVVAGLLSNESRNPSHARANGIRSNESCKFSHAGIRILIRACC